MNALPAILARATTRLLAAAALLLTAWTAGGAETNNLPVFHASFRAASDAAAADQSLVLLIFGADWCGPCRQLQQETLAAPEFLRQGGPLHIAEVDVDANQKTARDFGVSAIPSLLLLTADGKIAIRHTGFVNTSEMQAFLQGGRRRALSGQWDGTAPANPLDEYVKKAAADNLTTNDLQHLVEMLGEPDPADRAGISAILMAQRDQAVPGLIDGVTNPYLGVRIAAAELLQRLAPAIAPIDPWQSPEELAATAADLRKWWSATGTLPPAPKAHAADPALENSIKVELEYLRSDDPVRRTEAMSALAGDGADALPAVREAIRRAERSGDQRVIRWLEDVRWAILVPDALEKHAGGVRAILARGKSLERQSAAERLGKMGAEALGPLAELVNDADSLVAESAARALSEVGGDQAIPAMAALLAASDSNLRMTAAQALGHTKSDDAIKPLLTVADDPNEVVACTALAALQEARSSQEGTPASGPVPEEISAALRQCLGDPRWRVRAAAAEAAGKMNAHELAGDMKKLLEDADGFVVQKALAALNELGEPPDTAELAAIGKRLPGLRAGAVEMMLQSITKETVEAVTGMFNTSDATGQVSILQALAGQEGERDAMAVELGLNRAAIQNGNAEEKEDELSWKPLLTKAAASADARLRRGAAEALGRQPARLAAEIVAPLLADEDAATRAAAAEVVLSIVVPPAGPAAIRRPGAAAKTNAPPASASQMASWHAAMLQRTNGAPSLPLAAAVFATGDAKADLPLLLAALDKPVTTPARREQDATAIGLIMAKLPWPEGRAALDKFCGSPVLFAMAAQQSGKAAAGAAEYLLEPARFKSAVERASGDTLKGALKILAGNGQSSLSGEMLFVSGAAQGAASSWSLWGEDDRVKAITLALAESTNAAWRAAAVYSLGLRADAGQNAAIFEKALTNGNEWVRRAATQTLARQAKDRVALESCLGPLLSDTNVAVAGLAAELLLAPEIRQAAGLVSQLGWFEFDGTFGGRSSVGENINQNNDRPLTTLEGKPAFLEQAAKQAATAKPEESVPFALLLAQYGQFGGLDRLLAENAGKNAARPSETDDAILAGIALSQDAKYLPALRQMVAARNDQYQLRKILQALQGMRGAEARQLRLDINKKLRTVTSGP
jgi:HEAT repeat protein/thiol-disulfide isomerase/thioredoxin